MRRMGWGFVRAQGQADGRRSRAAAGTATGPRHATHRQRLTGDPRPATPEFGKLLFDMQVANAVAQIRSLVSR